LKPGDLLVANDARVLRARLRPRRREGGKAEVLLLHPSAEDGCWEAMVRPGKRVRKGDRLALDDACGIEIVDWAPDGHRVVRFFGIEADGAMALHGEVPLPPYIDRPPPDADERYQTIYSTRDGSVAAPTAGLHFTPELLDTLRLRGVGWTTITLHVGAGTFRPVKTDDVRDHLMHAELYEISEEAAGAIRDAREIGGRIVAVGTTSLRALEASAAQTGEVTAGSHWTPIFIHPPYRFKIVDALITNFHLPRSTLLMLVAAFAGRERILATYEEAIAREYRFYSFGDAMFVERSDSSTP
jgi:S-adenosylmethionine:tRNA ribosyltransferase-isomerase